MRKFVLENSLTFTNRGYSICRVRSFMFSAVVVIEQDRERDVYAIAEVGAGFCALHWSPGHDCMMEGGYWRPQDLAEREFAFRRCGGDDDGLYYVRGPYTPKCDCFGFNRWGTCKHCDVLCDIIRRGIL